MRFSIPRLFKHVRDQSVARVLTGAMAVPWYGPATLTLTAPNTYTGGTTINGGTLALGTSGTLGGATSTITVDAGNSATLDLLGTADKTITSGTITLNAGSQLTITRSEFVAATQSATSFTGALSGAGNLVIGGLSGAVTGRRTRFASSAPLGTGGAFDNFSGDITVQSGANLALFNGTLASANSNNLTVDSGGYVTLLGGTTTFVGALSGGGFITKNNGAGTTATLSVASGNFSGVIASNLLLGSGTMALTKTGNGTLTLSGTNTYAGATQVNAGELAITGSGRISASTAITIAANATFRESSTAIQIFGNISGGGDFIRDTTNTGLKTFSGNNSGFTGTMTLNTGTNLFSGANAGSSDATFVTGTAATGEIAFATGTYIINFGSLSGNGNFRRRRADLAAR